MDDTGSRQMSPAEFYEAFFVPAIFGPWAETLVARARVGPGQCLLDLARGTGIVARAAAARVGERGRIVALDLRPGMLAAARGLPRRDTGPEIEWMQGDAQDTGLPDETFEHVICQAGLQFFPDRPKALREARRILKPGGRLTVLTWQSMARQPVWSALADAEFRHLGHLGVTRQELDMPFSLGDPGELRGLLVGAGFRDVAIATEDRDADFPDPDRFVANMEYAYAAVIPELAGDPQAFARFVEAVTQDTREVVARHTRGDRIVFAMPAVIATGVR